MSGMRPAQDLVRHVDDRLRVLAPRAGRVGVAVSGGGDSVALACLLDEAGWEIALLHVDHGLRPDSAADEEVVRELARTLGCPVQALRIDVRSVAVGRGWNLADAARRLRREALHRLAKESGSDVIALGHTQDDQAETVLLQLLRGAAYLRGMRPRRGRLARPMLDVERAPLRAYLSTRGQPWRDDPGNEDLASARARVRHELLPLMERLAPGVSLRLARHACVQRDLEDHVQGEARRRVRGLPPSEEGVGRADAPPVEVDARTVAALPPALQREVVATLLRSAGARVDLAHVEAARERLGDVTPWRLPVGEARVLRGAYGRLGVVRPSEGAPAAPRVVRAADELPACVDPHVLGTGELVVRGRRPGDAIRLPGGRRSVADLLVDRKVPRERRDDLRVLARGSEVLWIEGVAVAVGAGPKPGVLASPEEAWMRRALELARAAGAAGEAPVGAVVVADGEVIGEGHNETEARRDPSAHAEVLALRAAAARRGDWRLADATLIVTLEPCAMCFGAVLQAHVTRVVYGARNGREGALGSVADLSTEAWKRSVRVDGGVLERECAALLSRFFARRRADPRSGASG